MNPKEKISGIRCDKCKKEVSHVVSNDPEREALMVRHETDLARNHREQCDGTVERFDALFVAEPEL
jgi:hypothetical protein